MGFTSNAAYDDFTPCAMQNKKLFLIPNGRGSFGFGTHALHIVIFTHIH